MGQKFKGQPVKPKEVVAVYKYIKEFSTEKDDQEQKIELLDAPDWAGVYDRKGKKLKFGKKEMTFVEKQVRERAPMKTKEVSVERKQVTEKRTEEEHFKLTG